MKKKISLFVILLLVILSLVFNAKYPFFTNTSKGWSVGYNEIDQVFPELNISDINLITSSEVNNFRTIDTSNFLADPFFLIEKDSIYLFVENAIVHDNARIDVFSSHKNNKKFKHKGIALDEKFHLSYPQVFKEDGKYYMIPETQGNKNVLLYATNNFPFDWKVSDTLIANIKYKDPTYLNYKDNRYLFVTDSELNLFVYTSNSLNGPWKMFEKHTKLRGNEARCGGRIFEIEEKLYLPMQNLSKGYGTGISLYRIDFRNEEINLTKEKHLFLRGIEEIPEFSKGMHHVDIQKFGKKYFAVYDGDEKKSKTVFNWKRTLKYNLIDLKLY